MTSKIITWSLTMANSSSEENVLACDSFDVEKDDGSLKIWI